MDQAEEMGLAFDYVICPSGTGGTQAGLILGLEQAHCPASVIGISVAQVYETQMKNVSVALEGTASLLGEVTRITSERATPGPRRS